MWKLGFLLAVWLVQETVLCTSDLTSEQDETGLDEKYDKMIEDYLSLLSSAHSRAPRRQKREVTYEDPVSLNDDIGVYRLQSVTPVARLCYPSLLTKFINIRNDTYAICVSAATLDVPAEVAVGLYKDRNWNLVAKWYIGTPGDVSAIYANGLLYVLVADSERVDGTDLVTVNLTTGETLLVYTMHSSATTSSAVWMMKFNGKHNLALANSRSQKDADDFSTEVFVFEWLGTYFDRYSSFLAYDVKDIEPFHIHNAAYLAVANLRKDQENYEVDSEIMKYDLDANTWTSYQKIRTLGAMDWEFFTLGIGTGQEFFLALANYGTPGNPNVNSMIYKFVRDKFVPFQCLKTSGATSIAALNDGYKFLLAVASINDAVRLYQYDGWRFVESSTQYTQGTMADGVHSVLFHKVIGYNAEVTILSVSNPMNSIYERSIFELGFQHENSLQEWYDRSTGWCLSKLDNLELKSADSAITGLDNVLYIDQETPITINGNLYLDEGFEASKLQTPKLQDESAVKMLDSSVLMKLQGLHSRLMHVSQKLEEFENILRNSIRIDGDQVIKGNLEFKQVNFDCINKRCHFDSINTTLLNGEDVTDWPNKLILLDRSQHIHAPLIAENIVANNVEVHGLVDGMDTKVLVTKSSDHVITEAKTFTNVIHAVNVEVHGLVDGVKFSPDNLLLTSGHQNITGNLVFEDVDTSWLEVSGLVNGIDLTKFYQDLVLAGKSYTITGEKVFNDVIIDQLVLSPGSTINGVDLADLWANALWKHGYQEIEAPMAFSSVTINGDLTSPTGINGIQIPGPRVVQIDQDAVIYEPQIFRDTTKISELIIENTINDIGMITTPDGMQHLDILLKNGNQVITGIKRFDTIHLDADSYVKGTVDGVDLSEFKKSVLYKGSKIESNSTWVFNNLVVKGPMKVSGTLSGIDLDDIYNRALKLSDGEMPEMEFTNVVHIDSLETNDINGIDVKRDLVLVNQSQTLTGTKVFQDLILEGTGNVVGLVNNINMSFLSDSLLRVGNQVITAPKTFHGNVHVKDITVTGSINNIPMDQFVMITGNQVIEGKRTLENVLFNNLMVDNLIIDGLVNGIDVKEMMTDTMTYEGHQAVTGTKYVKGVIHVADNANVQTSDLNGINLAELWADAVLLDDTRAISGRKIFAAGAIFENLRSESTIDGVNEWDMKYNWLMRDAPQVVEGNVVFQSDVAIRDLTVNGLVNGINIIELNSTIVKVNQPSIIEGPVIFDNHVISNGTVTLTGKIQGVDLSEEAITKSSNKVVTGLKTFAQDLIVEGDMTVHGLVDGASISDLCEKALVLNKAQNITTLVIKGDVTILGATVDGTVADVDLKAFKELAVKSDESGIVFKGTKTFTNLTIEGDLKINGLFGGVDLRELNYTYMSISRDQEIFSPMEFDELEITGTLSTPNFNAQIINGIDINSLDSRILKTYGAQTVSAPYNFEEVVFSEDVFVGGTVNGLSVPKDLMRRNRTNYIHSPKVFVKPVRILGNLDMEDGRLIQGVDVSAWKENAVMIDSGEYQIEGVKTFHDATFTDITVEGLMDGIKISEDTLLMSYGDQKITGRKTIRGDVQVNGHLAVHGLLNGTDLEHLATATVRRDRNNSITGTKYFKNSLTVHSLQAPSVAGVDLIALERNVSRGIDLGPLHERLEEMESIVISMQHVFENQAIVFQYYNLFQAFQIAGAYSWLHIIGDDCGELLLLLEAHVPYSHCVGAKFIRMFTFDNERQEFVPLVHELEVSSAAAVKSLFIWGRTYLIVANTLSDPACLERSKISNYANLTSEIYAWREEEFQLHQTLPNSAVDVVAFVDGSVACIVMLEEVETNVYCADGEAKHFVRSETLAARYALKAAITQYEEETIMAIVREPDYATHSILRSVGIYIWNKDKAEFSNPMQDISSTYADSVMFLTSTRHATEVFLVISEAALANVHNLPRLLIYRYNETSEMPFHKYQTIRDSGHLDWVTLPSGDVVFFTLNVRLDIINMYQYKGASGFVKVDTISTTGATAMHAFVRPDPLDDVNHYLALAGTSSQIAQASQYGFAKILKSKMKGRRWNRN